MLLQAFQDILLIFLVAEQLQIHNRVWKSQQLPHSRVRDNELKLKVVAGSLAHPPVANLSCNEEKHQRRTARCRLTYSELIKNVQPTADCRPCRGK